MVKSKYIQVKARKLVPLDRLREAPYNPESRKEARTLRALEDSMDMIGLLYPVIITPGEQIVEGHRRVEAARRMGWEDILCDVIEEDPETVYAGVNVSARSMTGHEALCCWLINPKSVSTGRDRIFQKMARDLGGDLMAQIADEGRSASTWQAARRLARYVGMAGDRDYLKKATKWLLGPGKAGVVTRLISAKADPGVLKEAVRRNRPIQLHITVQAETR